MTKEIAKLEDHTALDREIGADVDGEPLRFKDGGFIRGFDRVDVKLGTKMLLHPASTADGFIRWEDGKPTEFKLREWNNLTQLPILRDTLGDMDESQWPDGKDPWAYTMMIAMKDAEGVVLAFSTSTEGGKNAVRKVLREWKAQRAKHIGRVPVVSLNADSYEHKVHRTKVGFPVFEIVGWASWDGEEVPPLTATQQMAAALKQELNGDDIPAWAK
jgi:hypothetical protein